VFSWCGQDAAAQPRVEYIKNILDVYMKEKRDIISNRFTWNLLFIKHKTYMVTPQGLGQQIFRTFKTKLKQKRKW
jgi:hypothetical protein